MRRGVARFGVLLILTQILLACTTPATPTTTVPSPTNSVAAAATSAPAASATAAVVQPTSNGGVVSPSSTAIAPPATPTISSYPSPQAPAAPTNSSYPSPQAPVTPPPDSPYPSPATTTVPAALSTSTPVAATATPAAPVALTVNQIAATAIAGAAGEECVALPPKPAKGFVGDPVRGRMLFVDRGCSACHGDQAQGVVGPKLAGTILTFGAVIQQLRQPRGVMQRYLPKDQSDADECDVYQYVKNLKP